MLPGHQTLTKHQFRATICKSTLQPRQVITHRSGSQKVQKPQKYKGNMGTVRSYHCMSERTKLTHTRMCQPGVRKSQGQVYSSPTDQQSKWDKCDQVKNENFSVRSQWYQIVSTNTKIGHWSMTTNPNTTKIQQDTWDN